MAWTIELDSVARRDLKKLDIQTSRRILKFLHQRVSVLDNPRSIGEALTGDTLGGLWKYRVGDYRIITDIQDQKLIVLALRIGHRSNIYKNP